MAALVGLQGAVEGAGQGKGRPRGRGGSAWKVDVIPAGYCSILPAAFIATEKKTFHNYGRRCLTSVIYRGPGPARPGPPPSAA